MQYKIYQYNNGTPVAELKGFFKTEDLLQIISELDAVEIEPCSVCGKKYYHDNDCSIKDKFYALREAKS